MSTALIWLVIAAIAFVLWRINRRPVQHSAAEVAAMLRSLLAGTTGSREWAYFQSVQLQDPRLEDIRKRCVALWERGSPAVKRADSDPLPLTESGKGQVSELLAECEALKISPKTRAPSP
jgi:hypothetical protein